jgi:hypothetical protein
MDGVNADQALLEIRVERKAAPGPVLRMIDRFSLQLIPAHVVQLKPRLLQLAFEGTTDYTGNA